MVVRQVGEEEGRLVGAFEVWNLPSRKIVFKKNRRNQEDKRKQYIPLYCLCIKCSYVLYYTPFNVRQGSATLFT